MGLIKGKDTQEGGGGLMVVEKFSEGSRGELVEHEGGFVGLGFG